MPPRKKIAPVIEPSVHTEPTHDEAANIKAEAMKQGVHAIDLKRELFSSRSPLKFVAKTEDKLIFKIVKTGGILVTDFYGIKEGKQHIFYALQARPSKAAKFSEGDGVYVFRPIARGRKVFYGRVVSREPNGNLVVDLEDRDYFPMASKRNYGDTHFKVFPVSMVFKDPREIEAIANSIKSDLEIAKTQHREYLQTHNGAAVHA